MANRNLTEQLRKVNDQFNVSVLNALARYESEIYKTDENLVEDIDLAIDKYKAQLSNLKALIQEGVL